MDEPIAVVGGGIAGASAAYHLSASTDRSVVVYERGDLAGETTAKSAAHFGGYGSPVERRMKRYGLERYNEFLADPRAEPRFDLLGRLWVATTSEVADDLEARAGDDDAESYLAPDEVARTVLFPELDATAIEGALHRPNVGYFRPRELAREFVARARENGAAFRTGTAVTDVTVDDGRVTGIEVEGGREPVAAVVCAAGPWNLRVARMAGVDLPASHTLAPILELDPGEAVHALPILTHRESDVYVRGARDGRVLVGQYPGGDTEYDPGDVPDRVPDDIRVEMWDAVEELLPSLADAEVVGERVGVRSHTPDGNPIVGWTAVEGFSVVAFNSSGIQLSPAAGDVIARQLVEGDPTEHHDALSIARFDGHDETPFSL